jgi:hypothetical protein
LNPRLDVIERFIPANDTAMVNAGGAPISNGLQLGQSWLYALTS